MSKNEIAQEFNNSNNMYYGHGIGANNEEVINSIFENGLRCSHEQLNFTTYPLGEGSDKLFEEIQEKLDNWQHKNSKQIIIASLPCKYHLIGPMGTNLYGKEQAAFYNYFSQDDADKMGIPQGYYLRPEFVRGVYDANTKTFIPNEKYYEYLPMEQQQQIFNEVKRQYIDLLKGSPWTLEEYSEILKEINGSEMPLTQEEIANADREVFDANKLEEQLQSIVGFSKQTDFNEATKNIKDNGNERKVEEEQYTEEGWTLDDDWE